MTDEAQIPAGDQVGWRVLDPDGNVVASGPGMVLEMAAGMTDAPVEATDGRD